VNPPTALARQFIVGKRTGESSFVLPTDEEIDAVSPMVEELLESIEEGDRVDELATGDASSPMYSNLFSTSTISLLFPQM